MEENRSKVNKALKDKKIDMALNIKWPFISQFMRFLENKGIMRELKNIVGDQKRKIIGNHIFALLYILKLIVDIPRIRGSEALFSDLGTMKLLNFNEDMLQNGLSNRGDTNQYGKGYKKTVLCHERVHINRQYREIFQAEHYAYL